MQSWIRMLLGLLVVHGLAQATPARASVNPQAPDAQAVAAYRAGDLAAARAAWNAVLEAGVEGPERGRILANLGHAAFREGRALESVGWFSASLRLRPRDSDTWSNLEHARRVAQLEPADRGDLAATLRRVLGAFTPAESRLLALAGLFVLATTLAFEALRGGRAGRRIAFAGLLAAFLSAGPWLHGAWTANEAPALVVAEGKAPVRSEPREGAAVVAQAQAGDEVDVLDALPGWAKVRLADGAEGWVVERAVFALAR